MDRHIFQREIVVIFVVGIEIFHFFFIQRHPQGPHVFFSRKIAAVSGAGYFFGERGREAEFDEKFLMPCPMQILIVVGLYFFCLCQLAENIAVGKNRQDLEHACQVVIIVAEDGIVCIAGLIFNKFMVDADQLAAVKGIFPVDSQKLLQCFLFAVGQFQKVLQWSNPFINVDSGKAGEVIGKTVSGTFL